MKLKGKLSLLLVSFTILFALCGWAIQKLLIVPNFQAIERNRAGRELGRTTAALHQEIDRLDSLCDDWAKRNDTNRFVAGRDAPFVSAALGPTSFTANRLNLIIIYDAGGRYLAGSAFDLQGGNVFTLPAFPPTQLPDTFAKCLHLQHGQAHTGIVLTSRGPLLLSCQPIRSAGSSTTPRGLLLMGSFLDPGKIARLGKNLVQNLSIQPISTLDGPQRQILAALEKRPDTPYIMAAGRLMQAFTTFPDMFGNSALLIRIDFSRELFFQSLRTSRLFLYLSVLADLLVTLLLLLLTQKVIVGPIDRLARHIVTIRDDDDPRPLDMDRGAEEIVILVREFNSLVTRLESKRLAQEENRREREKLIAELQDALSKVKQLKGMLPICAHCKKIRDDRGYWNQIETYIRDHSEAEFTHGICTECARKLYPDLYPTGDQAKRPGNPGTPGGEAKTG